MATPWSVPREWEGKTAFIIGGGPSLKSFDRWDRLHKSNVIAINDAFRLDPANQWIDYVIFGDRPWFDITRHELVDRHLRGGKLVTCWRDYKTYPAWVWTCLRQSGGFSADPERLAWNGNTGAAAINLAVLLGAKRIVLLGFDMRLAKNGDPNWYPQRRRAATQDILNRYRDDMKQHLVKGVREAGAVVWNANPHSGLQGWPKIELEEALCRWA